MGLEIDDALKAIIAQLIIEAIKEYGPQILEALAGLIIALLQGLDNKQQASFYANASQAAAQFTARKVA